MGRIALLSDLHMGSGDHSEQFRADAALRAQLEAFAWDKSLSDVVLLGDTFDLSGSGTASGSQSAALSRLRTVLHAHPDVVTAMRSIVRHGKRLHFVQGNHDVELAGEQIQAALRQSLAAVDASNIHFVPWLCHIPGLLLAEHGNQHHDINAFDTVLQPLSDLGEIAAQPFGAKLARLRDQHGAVSVLPRAAWTATSEATRLCGRARKDRRTAYRREVLPRYAAQVDLSEQCVLDLDRLGQHGPVAILCRLARQAVRRSDRSYLILAAHKVRQALGDAAPPFIVMGHSHSADARLLVSETHAAPAVYLNTGTWSLRGPGVRDTTLRPTTRTWVEIDPAKGRRTARAEVLHLAGDGTRMLLAEATATGSVTRASRSSQTINST